MKKVATSKGKKFSLGGVKNGSSSDILENCDPEKLWNAAIAVVKSGCALTIASTRDGSTLVITVLENGEAERAYAEDVTQAEDILDQITKLGEADQD